MPLISLGLIALIVLGWALVLWLLEIGYGRRTFATGTSVSLPLLGLVCWQLVRLF